LKARDRYSNEDCRRKTAIELPEKKLGRSTFGFFSITKISGKWCIGDCIAGKNPSKLKDCVLEGIIA
jgi:hypothetical protein